MTERSVLNLDHAATSALKPAVVGERLTRYFQEGALSAGRSGSQRSQQMSREIASARAALARLLGAARPEQLVFTSGGTEGLNLVLQRWLKPGDHVVITALEHNSVLRPLTWLQQTLGVSVTQVEPESHGCVDVAAVAAAIQSETRLICCVHASNVLGTLQPVAEICELARKQGVATLIDAAQTAGHVPIDVQAWGCDFLVTPAHKGLLGPLGTGVAYLAEGREELLPPLLLGGTGTFSEQALQPLDMPGRYESGSPNVPGLLGLAAALTVVTPEFVRAEQQRQHALTTHFLERLSSISGLTVYAAEAPREQRVGVVSLNIAGYDPRIVETILDAHYGIEVRSGFHCAPQAHAWLGTAAIGGTVRCSWGYGTTPADLERAATALQEIAASTT